MAENDPISLNVRGVTDLVENPTNKSDKAVNQNEEGVSSEKYGALSLSMSDEKLLKLRNDWEAAYATYEVKVKRTREKNLESYIGKRPDGQWLTGEDTIAANLQFEAEETFLAATLSKNPEPVVFSDNTKEGVAIATAVRTMLQYHAIELCLRRKLGIMARQWSINHLAVLKLGWDKKVDDVAIENRKIQNFIFDPEGYVDANGHFVGYIGERIKVKAEELIALFPSSKSYIELQTEGKLGTSVTYTEWWTDDFCFITYKDKILDKHKNEFYRYPEQEKDLTGAPVLDEMGQPKMITPRNHFAYPQKPYVFLSVFSLQEQPHDITGLIEQNIPNQNLIRRRTEQIDYNISRANNSDVFSEDNFNQETAKQAANALKKGNPVLVPSGAPIGNAIVRLPAPAIPNDTFTALETAKADLRTSWGVQGITAEPQDEDQTARGMILNQAHDTSRIGGGIGGAIEQVASAVFNWITQLYYVFYDDQHFAAVMGNAKTTEYVVFSNADLNRQLIVTVSPDSMRPKDQITELNLAQALYDKGVIGPKTLLKMVDFPNPDEAAEDGVLWATDKMAYVRLNFPDLFAKLQTANAEMIQAAGGVGTPPSIEPEQTTEPPQEMVDPASAALSQVPLPA